MNEMYEFFYGNQTRKYITLFSAFVIAHIICLPFLGKLQDEWYIILVLGVTVLLTFPLAAFYMNDHALKLTKRILIQAYNTSRHVILFTFLVVIMMLLNRKLEKPALAQDQALLQNFVEWYAVIYALALGLIIGQAWKKYNMLNSQINREADALQLMMNTVKMFHDDKLIADFHSTVKHYANSVKLWYKDKDLEGDFDKEMEVISSKIEKIVRHSDVQESLKSELLSQFAIAYTARRDRIRLIMQKLPSSLWIVAGLLFLFWLFAFSWLDIEVNSLKNFVLGCTVFTITYLLSLARELDDPATVIRKLSFKPFEQRLLNSEESIVSPEVKQRFEYDARLVRLSPFLALSFRPAFLFAIAVLVLFNTL